MRGDTHWLLTFVKVGGRQDARHGMILAHLLKHLDEESNLNLGSLLQQSVQGGGAFGLTQDPKPLFNGAQLILEVLIQGGGGHLLQRRLVLIDVGYPLLSDLVLRIGVGAAMPVTLLALAVEVRRGPNTTGRRRARESCHVGGGTEGAARAYGTGGGWPQGRRGVRFGSAVAVPDGMVSRHVEHSLSTTTERGTRNLADGRWKTWEREADDGVKGGVARLGGSSVKLLQ